MSKTFERDTVTVVFFILFSGPIRAPGHLLHSTYRRQNQTISSLISLQNLRGWIFYFEETLPRNVLTS